MGQGGSTPGQGASLTPRAASAASATERPIVKISPLFEALLNSADGLLSRVNQPSAAVLIAQTAIEVCTERLITKLLDKRGVKFLEDWIDARLPNYEIFNPTVRPL
jgi:hypothetical protein